MRTLLIIPSDDKWSAFWEVLIFRNSFFRTKKMGTLMLSWYKNPNVASWPDLRSIWKSCNSISYWSAWCKSQLPGSPSSFLLTYHGKEQMTAQAFGLDSHRGDLDGDPGSRFQPGPASAATGRVNQHMEHLSLSLCYSTSQIINQCKHGINVYVSRVNILIEMHNLLSLIILFHKHSAKVLRHVYSNLSGSSGRNS